MAAALWVDLIKALIWPAIFLASAYVCRERIAKVSEALQRRVEAGAALKFYSLEVGEAPTNLPSAVATELVAANHLALVHSSWRFPRKDAEFGRRMWGVHVIVQARDDVLDRIEYVKYILDPSYPNREQVVTDRTTRFKLKELANGESTVRAEIKIKGQEEVLSLSRYINLTDTGPRI